ncbi:hypothetical protein [Nodosilinea nodulosa]|uniref:hypothetical protein n=1 Tax=Nodosilinea nodulosa TaxID=416001 RepID=UPI0002DB9C87|nr:hypothetical protein [Nodosilinea nodulosa]
MTAIRAWTTQKLAALGLWLAGAFGFGADSAQTPVAKDTWTPDTLTSFGLEMGKGFGSGS